MLKTSLAFMLILCYSLTYGQSTLTIIAEDYDKRPLNEVYIGLESLESEKKYARLTKATGAVYLNVPPGKYQVLVDGGLNYEKLNDEFTLTGGDTLRFYLASRSHQLPEVSVSSDRIDPISPTIMESIDRKEIQRIADGRELPQLLQGLTSIISHSDAGNGVGYSYLRIRGSDQTRINVSINGVPLNDAESHQVFWVNMPDISNGLSEIQVQRGVGTSTFGPAAFGANVKLSTGGLQEDGVLYRSNVASYDTYRNALSVKHNGLTLRLSDIRSQGYIDRASSNLQSYFLQYDKSVGDHNFKIMHTKGSERTYQSWNGVPEAIINGNGEALQDHIDRNSYSEAETENLLTSDRRYNYYEYKNEIDQYRQAHTQLHWKWSPERRYWSFAAVLHHTHGQGYFEQFKQSENAVDYGVPPLIFAQDTVQSGDIVRRRWLKNHFYGIQTSALWKKGIMQSKTALSANQYVGDHFGRLVSGDFVPASADFPYYSSEAFKGDYSIYNQTHYAWDRWIAYLDLQYRTIRYSTQGNNNDLLEFDVDESFHFFNPKFGIQYKYLNHRLFASLGVSNREPVRNDFINQEELRSPKAERLTDLEIGGSLRFNKSHILANVFLMQYKDQLIPTGALNDVGALLRTNVPESQRLGAEFSAWYEPIPMLKLAFNSTIMRSTIGEWTEAIYDYGSNEVLENVYRNSPMSMSPDWLFNTSVEYIFLQDFTIQWQSQYVSEQFLDNTGRHDRKTDEYFIHHLGIEWNKRYGKREISLQAKTFNLFDYQYEGFGYTYSYAFNDQLTTENFYYPQAPRNFNVGLSLKF